MSRSAVAPPPWRGWWRARTLLARLTIGTVAVLLLACLVLGVSTELFVRGFLLHRIDNELVAAGGRYSISLERGGTARDPDKDGDDDSVPGQSVGTLGARLLDGTVTDAAVVTEAGTNRQLHLSSDNQALLDAVTPGSAPRSLDLRGIGDYRVRAVRGRDGDVQLTGLPLAAMKGTLTQLVVVDAALFVLVFLLGGGATALVVYRNLRPLHQLTETALRVSEQELISPETLLPAVVPPSESGSEVDRLNVAFHRMLDRVHQGLTARDVTEARLRRFVADASHELRTPLATIRAHNEYALSVDQPIPPQVSTSLDRIAAATDRMSTLVADLLVLARLDTGRPLERAPVDLTRLVLDSLADARTNAPEHRWRLDLPEESVVLLGDEERLHQVVTNLLTNARTHTPPGTQVLTRVAVGAGEVTLVVADDGPGVPPELLPQLFDRFVRGDASRSRSHGGSGLGLAIAQGIVVAHEGSLRVRSTEGGGTTFEVSLPG